MTPGETRGKTTETREKRMRKFYFIILLLSVPMLVSSQLHWKKVSDAFGYLPKSIALYKTTDSLNGRPFIAYYIEAKLNDRNLEFTTDTAKGRRLTPSQFYTKEDSAYIIVNGTFFSFQTNQNLNLLMKEGKLIAYNTPSLKSKNTDSFYYPTRSAIGITKKRKADAAWIFTDTAQRWAYAFQQKPIVAKGKNPDPSFDNLNTLDYWKAWRMETAIGGGPMLLQNGQIRITNKEEQMFVAGEKDKHPRTAMGYTKKGKLIILVIQGRFPGVAEGATLEEEAKILKDLRCIEALNLDGGGSSCMLINGIETIQPSDKEGQRAVPGVFVIRSKKTFTVY